MKQEILEAINNVVNQMLEGKDPSEVDEKGAGMFWDLSRTLVDHYQAEIGEPMEATDIVYYTLYDVTNELMNNFVRLMHEMGIIEMADDKEEVQ